MQIDEVIIASACLLGIKCNYKGGAKPNNMLKREYERGNVYPVCPEVFGHLPLPRCPSEIWEGTGYDVLDGKAKVYSMNKDTCEFHDVTENFINGAIMTLYKAIESGAKKAVLKARSPSCGCGKITNGTFSKTMRNGDGVAAALLKRNGIIVMTEEE